MQLQPQFDFKLFRQNLFSSSVAGMVGGFLLVLFGSVGLLIDDPVSWIMNDLLFTLAMYAWFSIVGVVCGLILGFVAGLLFSALFALLWPMKLPTIKKFSLRVGLAVGVTYPLFTLYHNIRLDYWRESSELLLFSIFLPIWGYLIGVIGFWMFSRQVAK